MDRKDPNREAYDEHLDDLLRELRDKYGPGDTATKLLQFILKDLRGLQSVAVSHNTRLGWLEMDNQNQNQKL